MRSNPIHTAFRRWHSCCSLILYLTMSSRLSFTNKKKQTPWALCFIPRGKKSACFVSHFENNGLWITVSYTIMYAFVSCYLYRVFVVEAHLLLQENIQQPWNVASVSIHCNMMWLIIWNSGKKYQNMYQCWFTFNLCLKKNFFLISISNLNP